jgi:hypothetical protein
MQEVFPGAAFQNPGLLDARFTGRDSGKPHGVEA